MTTPIQLPLINGVRHSYASIEAKIAGQIFLGFKSINYSAPRERVKLWGTHPDPLGKTRGKMDYKADVEVWLAECNQLFALLATQAQQLFGITSGGFGDVLFPLIVTYSENGFDTIQDVVNGCSTDGIEAANAESADPLSRKLDLNPLKVFWNQLDQLAVPLANVPT